MGIKIVDLAPEIVVYRKSCLSYFYCFPKYSQDEFICLANFHSRPAAAIQVIYQH